MTYQGRPGWKISSSVRSAMAPLAGGAAVSGGGASWVGACSLFLGRAKGDGPLAEEDAVDEPAKADIDGAQEGADEYGHHHHDDSEMDGVLTAGPDDLPQLGDDVHDETWPPAGNGRQPRP